jgi:hypothetical protein
MLEDFLHRITVVGNGYPWLGLVSKCTCLGTGLELLVVYGGNGWEWLEIVGNGQEWLRIVVNDPVIDENLVGIFSLKVIDWLC